MHPLYQHADDVQQAATVLVMAYGAEGKRNYPHSKASHICFRTTGAAEQAHLFKVASALGTPHTSGTADKPRYWVHLRAPISGHDMPGDNFAWLEITGPKVDDATGKEHPTGPQMLVYVDAFLDAPIKTPGSKDPRINLRCQSATPQQQLAAA